MFGHISHSVEVQLAPLFLEGPKARGSPTRGLGLWVPGRSGRTAGASPPPSLASAAPGTWPCAPPDLHSSVMSLPRSSSRLAPGAILLVPLATGWTTLGAERRAHRREPAIR